ncbi:MAG: CPBP family intramembrane metalloprotease [Balneolaceae bacterium]|nr:CPBP family intramembrane metalloprotease [Balneolaceae bacterium]
MRKELKYSIGVFFFFALFYISKKLWFNELYHFINEFLRISPVSFFIAYMAVGTPLLGFVYWTEKFASFKILGLNRSIGKALLFSLLFTSPMFIGYGIISDFNISLETGEFWRGNVFAAFFEELYYRAFLFGLLYRKTRLGFIPSLIASALIFASLHLYQSNDFATLTGVFITTFLGGAFFAWLYVEWDFNLWVPIGMHFFMNLSWTIFSISDNAFGDGAANLFRILTIIAAIVGTIIYKKRNQQSMEVSRTTLLIKDGL